MAAKVTNCLACGKVAACDAYHVRGFRDETCSNETVDWVGWLCDECEDRLLALLDGNDNPTKASAAWGMQARTSKKSNEA